MLALVWVGLLIWLFIGIWNGLLSRKEVYCISTMMDSIAVMLCVKFVFTEHGFWFWWGLILLPLNARNAWRSYKKWRDSDDDDDFRKKRRVRLLSKIPRPTVVQLRPLEITRTLG